MATYKVRYELDESGTYVVSIPVIPGCHTQSDSIEQGEERIREALSLFISDKEAASADLVVDIMPS